MKEAIQKVTQRQNLTEAEAMAVMQDIMEGNATPAQIAGFIVALRMKGETIEEITGCARVMREKTERITPSVAYAVDTCGTGGDGHNTINISTAAAILTAAGGVTVAKHGNRSASSLCGSADVLEALGVNLALLPKQVETCMEQVGIGFMFAQKFHQSMKHAAVPRRELGIKTVFNILGPLTNPADAKGQVLGVFSPELTNTLANVLLKLGVEKAMVIHGRDGLDEITTTAATKVSEVIHGEVIDYEITPEEFGLQKSSLSSLKGGDAKENATILQSIFKGEKGALRDIVVLNSGAALYVGKAVQSIKEGVALAEELIDSGKALQKLNEFIAFTNSFKQDA